MTTQDEKNENNLVGENLNVNNQEEKNESSPFDSEEVLDIEQEEKNENEPAEGKSKMMRNIIIGLLILAPIVYIFYKTKSNPAEAPVAAAAQGIDVAAYENAANANPTYSNLLNLSNAYINSGMAGKAIAPLNKAIESNPQAAAAYNNLGFAYTIIGQYKNGIAACQKAVDLDSTFLLAKNNLNWAKTEQQKLLDIITELDKTPEKDRTTFYYTGLGLNYLKLQEYDKAIETWNKILVTEPKNSGALINIGVAYMSQLKYDDAVKSFQKAVDADANDQLAKNNLGWAVDEKKKEAEAKKLEADEKKKGATEKK